MKQLVSVVVVCCASINALSQPGNVGINTTTPKAMLHVKDSSVLFGGATPGVINYGANPPATGPGTRMMWFAQRAAFRAGRVSDFEWDRDSIGVYSVAFGDANKAIGESSFAIGVITEARGAGSISGGFLSIARGIYSVALGEMTEAKGNYSIATGLTTRADGDRSSAFGNGTIVKSPDCIVVGMFNDTLLMTSPGIQDFSQPLFVVGSGSSNNNRKNVLTVLGNGRVGIGLGPFSTNVRASLHLHNPGTYQQQLAFTSIFSASDTAYIKWEDRELTFRNTSPSGSFWQFEDKNGVRKVLISSVNGDIATEGGWTAKTACGINTISPLAGLHIKALDNTFDQHIRLESTLGPSSYANIVYDGLLKCRVFDPTGGFQWRNSGSNILMTLASTGNLTIAGTLTQNSDARLKKEITPLENSLEKILSLNGYHYQWKDSARGAALQTGLLAQQIEALMPELVSKDEEGILSVNYNGLIPYLVEAVKSQQQMIDELKEQNRLLKSNRRK